MHGTWAGFITLGMPGSDGMTPRRAAGLLRPVSAVTPTALANLGYFAHEGIGGPQDEALALDATARAAAAGSTYGAGLNGLYRLSRLADGQHDPDAVANLERAVDAGELFAQAARGTIVYELGVGAAENWERAAHYARLAADKGHGPSMTELARMMFVGRGVAQDERGAVAMFRRAAEAGDPAGMSFLGQLYTTGQGVPRDIAAGMDLFRRAADLGHPEAQGVYGLSLMLGQGVEKTFPKGCATSASEPPATIRKP